MTVSYAGKSRVNDVDYILVDCETWEGPLHVGQKGRYVTETLFCPREQTAAISGRRVQIAYHRQNEDGDMEGAGAIADSCKGHSEVAKRFKWSRPTAPEPAAKIEGEE